ncbi:hypothetical protein AAFF_G00087330, partial [Aldrovandia affinis]
SKHRSSESGDDKTSQDSSSNIGEDKLRCKNVKLKVAQDCTRAVGNQNKRAKCFKVKNLEKNHGVFACVQTQLKNIYPFKSSDQNDYFILAFATPKVVTTLAENRELKIPEGQPIILTCSFNFSKDFNGKPYVLYWMKTSGESSTCVYSYEADSYGPRYDTHCSFAKGHLSRVSTITSGNPFSNPHLHNLTINTSTQLDSGQYVCALNVIKRSEGYWVVITNITVTVDKKEPLDRTTTITDFTVTVDKKEQSYRTTTITDLTVTVDKKEPLERKGTSTIGVFAIAFYMKKKNITAKGSEFVRKQRHQSGKETADPDCSPYAVSGRELEPYSVVRLSASPADCAEGGQAKVSAEPYSVVRLNSQYEASPPSPQEDQDGSRPGTGRDAGKRSEESMDTGTNVYERINNTYSTCQ